MPADTRAENPSLPRASRIDLLEGMSPSLIHKLMASGARHEASRGELLYCQGELLDRLFVVENGSFKLVRQTDEGRELIIALAGPGDVFGAVSERTAAGNHAHALERSTCLSFPVEAIHEAIDEAPRLAVRLLRHLEEQRGRAQRAAASVVFDSVPERLATLIAATSDPRTGLLRFPLTQTELANIIGSSRETVCSILNRFRREGALALSRGRIRVLDRKRLL